MFTTLSQPLVVLYVCEYVPAVDAVPPQGRLYAVPWQVDAVVFVIDVELMLNVMFTILSQPLTVVYVCEYTPAVEAVPPHGKLYGVDGQVDAVLFTV